MRHYPHKLIHFIPHVLITLGSLMLGVSIIHQVFYTEAISLYKNITNQYVPPKSAKPRAVQITIGSISLPIEEAVLVGNVWSVSPTSANHIAQSANPEEQGNIIIYGHNRPTIFHGLLNLTGSEPVTLKTADGAIHRYKITEIHDVNPRETQYLLPTQAEVLTVYTCSGFLDSKRRILRAVPI